MNSAEFKKRGHEMIDFVADFMDKIRDRQCLPGVKPGYLAQLIPANPPEKPEKWEKIMKDIEPCIMDGMTHWQHPNFHAYFPSGNSWPSILGGILSNGVGISGASWQSCPAATELEIIVLDWVAKFLGLPETFYSNFSNKDSHGGGVIQGSASESILLSMIAARERAIKKLREIHPTKHRAGLLKMLVAYANNQSHSSVEKASIIANVQIRLLEPGDRGSLRAEILQQAIQDDIEKGFYPFFVSTILGSTSICSFDDLEEIGPICTARKIWLHVDGAYAGAAFICPETRYLMRGMEHAFSFNINCNKWMLTNFDCSLHWFRHKHHLTDCLSGNDLSLHDKFIIDYRHWSISHARRFRALKLWMVIRTYGVEGIQKYIRKHIEMAKIFEKYVFRDPRFVCIGETRTGLCCFRLLGPDSVTIKLLEAVNTSRKLYMVPASFQGKYIIRFAMCGEEDTLEDIDYAWKVISRHASVVIRQFEMEKHADLKDMGELLEAQAIVDAVHKAELLEGLVEEAQERDLTFLALSSLEEIHRRSSSGDYDFLVRRATIIDPFFGIENIQYPGELDEHVLDAVTIG